MPRTIARPPTEAAARGAAGVGPADATEPSRDRSDATRAALTSVRRLVRSLRLAARRVEAEVGLSAAQLFVLRQVEAAPAASLGDLAARTMTDRTSVAAVVDRLAARGLVERARSEVDRRRAAVRLSPTGRALLRTAPRAPTTDLLAGLERLSDDDLHRLAAGLTRLTEVMGLGGDHAEFLFADEADEADEAHRRAGGEAPTAVTQRPGVGS